MATNSNKRVPVNKKTNRPLSVKQVLALKDKMSDVETATGKKLTIKEAKFIDEYIKTGNGSQSIKTAGYKYSNNDNDFASQLAQEMLHKPYIKQEIQNRMESMHKKSIADREEIMEFLSKMMRGEILDQFDMPATNGDKIKAGIELAKRSIDIEDRINERKTTQTQAPEIKISLQWEDDKNGKK